MYKNRLKAPKLFFSSENIFLYAALWRKEGGSSTPEARPPPTTTGLLRLLLLVEVPVDVPEELVLLELPAVMHLYIRFLNVFFWIFYIFF
jgi:hypothetical protein